MPQTLNNSSFFSLCLECCPVGVMAASSKNGGLEFINDKCREILHLNEAKLHNRNVADILSDLNGLDVNGRQIAPDEFPIVKSLREEGVSTLLFSMLHNENKRIISMRSSSIVVNGSIRGAVSTVEDISEEFKMRNSLESSAMRLKNLWRVTKSSSISIKEICDVTLEAIAEITQSKFGFFGFMDDGEENMIIHSWTGETMKGCTVVDKPVVFPIKKAGLWAEAIRQRTPLIVNDFSACRLPRKGFPEGHVKLKNLMVVPHFIGDKIYSLAAVGNKDFGYDMEHVVKIEEFLKDIQSVIKQIEAETLLKESEKKYRNLVELMNEGVLVLNQEGVVTFVNSRICELLDREISEVVDHKFEDFVYADSKETFIQQQHLRKKGSSEPYEMTLVNKGGDKVYALSSPTPLISEDGDIAGSYEVVTNISNIKQIERQLLHSQKMETIGVLAAGIAHEINTPLQYIVGNAYFIKDSTEQLINISKFIKSELGDGTIPDSTGAIKKKFDELDLDDIAEEVPAAIEDSIEGLNRISSIVKSVKGFAHIGPNELIKIDVNRRIREAVNISRNEWKDNAEVLTDFDDDLPQLLYTPSDFDQIILNLMVNASQALEDKFGGMETKGLITISTFHDDNFITISIKDNGNGIPDKIKTKIFDPFFTTKEVGKGTGMGLSIISQLIEKHQGKIWFESQEWETTFYIRTPIN